MSNEDHKEIYLQPECCAGDEGRLWCEDPDPIDCEDGKPWTRYVRADIPDIPEVPGVYYRVYQDKENMDGGHYVDTLEGVVRSISNWRESVAESDEFLWPVIEPVEMTEEEFKALPEFTGY